MRLIYFCILLFLVTAVGIFVLQNNEPITLQYLGHSIECSPWVLLGIVYLLGMVSGGTVIGLLHRSLQRVSERHAQQSSAT